VFAKNDWRHRDDPENIIGTCWNFADTFYLQWSIFACFDPLSFSAFVSRQIKKPMLSKQLIWLGN